MAIKYIYLTLFVLTTNIIVSQNKTIDSLKLALKNAKHDTTKVGMLIQLGENMYLAQPDSALNLWYRANKIIEKNLSINSDLNKKFYLKNLANSFDNIGSVTYYKGEFKKALEFHKKSLAIREKAGDMDGVSQSLNNLGVIYKKQGEIDKSLDCYMKSLEISEQVGDESRKATCLNNIASIYFSLGDIIKSLDYNHKSLAIREKIRDKNGIAYSLGNLGSIYSSQGEIPKALEYAKKSLKIRQELGDKNEIAHCLNSIGIYYHQLEKLEEALRFYFESLKLKEEIDDKHGIANVLDGIGSVYARQGNFTKAMEYYQRGLKICEEIEDKAGTANSLQSISIAYRKQGQIELALKFAKRSMDISKELGFPDDIKISASILKSTYLTQNKYKEAFEMYELEIKMRDSINNQETQKAAVKKEMQYTYEKKELEAKAEQDKKDIIAKEELKQKEKERNYFIAGFALVIILALFIFRGYRQKQRANVLISEQKHLVEEKQKEIIDSIHYARRIQRALITPEKYIDKKLKDLQS